MQITRALQSNLTDAKGKPIIVDGFAGAKTIAAAQRADKTGLLASMLRNDGFLSRSEIETLKESDIPALKIFANNDFDSSFANFKAHIPLDPYHYSEDTKKLQKWFNKQIDNGDLATTKLIEDGHFGKRTQQVLDLWRQGKFTVGHLSGYYLGVGADEWENYIKPNLS